jgi:hypothetical protein
VKRKRKDPRATAAAPASESDFSIRLLDRRETAAMCRVHVWTIDAWVLAGHLKPLVLPAPMRRRNGDRRMRRVLFDARDVIAFLERAKTDGTRGQEDAK